MNQVGEDPFNRAKLLNVGFMEALKLYDWQCFVFHDVDLGLFFLIDFNSSFTVVLYMTHLALNISSESNIPWELR